MTSENSNIDQEEINKFEQLASTWWDLDGDSKALHEINPLRLQFMTDRTPLSGKKVIDVGCGGGILSEAMAKAGADVTGIDMGEAPLQIAQQHADDNNVKIKYQRIQAEVIAEEEAGQYDIVTCMEMLEHVPDPAAIVNACHKLVKPGGHVFFSTINRNPKSYMLAVIGAEYVLGIVPKGTHDYNKFIKPSELSRWSRNVELEVKDLGGMHYNPITFIHKLNRDVSVNYLMHTVRPA